MFKATHLKGWLVCLFWWSSITEYTVEMKVLLPPTHNPLFQKEPLLTVSFQNSLCMSVSLKIAKDSTLPSNSVPYSFHWPLYLKDLLHSPSITLKVFKLKYSWRTILCYLQVFYIVIWYLHPLWNDHPNNSSNHLSPKLVQHYWPYALCFYSISQ